MSISATQEGRNLHLHVEGIDTPFIIKPLPAPAGMQITYTYLRTATGLATREETAEAIAMAVDGATLDGEKWVPADRPVGTRMEQELSIGETEDVAMAAFFWQTILNDTGVNIYLNAGGGVEGHTKAMRALIERLGLSPLLTSPSSALDALTQLQESSPSTSTPQGGGKPGRRLFDRLPKKSNRKGR